MKILSVIFIIPTYIVLSIIHIILFLVSRKKLASVRPESMFGSEAEIADKRRKQIKVAFFRLSQLHTSFVCFQWIFYHCMSWCSIKRL